MLETVLDWLESDASLLSFKCSRTGMLLWPLVRRWTIQGIIQHLNDFISPISAPVGGRYWRACRYLIRSMRLQRQLPQATWLYWGHNFHCINHKQGYMNRVLDYWASVDIEQSVLLELAYNQQFLLPRTYANWLSRDVVSLKVQLCSRLTRLPKEEVDTIAAMRNCLQSKVDMPSAFWSQFTNHLTYYCKRLPALHRQYQRTLKTIQPRALFAVAACYGGDDAVLVNVAKALDIPVVEPQHGLISHGHVAYNFGSGIRAASAYQQYLPDYFLSYGDYWSGQVNMPVKCISVGNPHLTETVKRYVSQAKSGQSVKTILVISSGNQPKMMTQFIQLLHDQLDQSQYQVMLRPHPGERTDLYDRYPELKQLGIIFDLEQNLFQSLSHVDIVVGEGSTVLFEALAMQKKVYALDNAVTALCMRKGNELIPLVKDAAEFVTVLNESKQTILKQQIESVWAPDWQGRFRAFLQTIA